MSKRCSLPLLKRHHGRFLLHAPEKTRLSAVCQWRRQIVPDGVVQVAKKLRYMVEFFKTLPKIADKPKVLTRFLRCLEELQTRLGKVHDGEAKIAFLQEEVRNLSEEASHSAAFAAGVLAGAPGDTSHQLERSIEAYSQVAKANPFS
jgi:hypothetical protein